MSPFWVQSYTTRFATAPWFPSSILEMMYFQGMILIFSIVCMELMTISFFDVEQKSAIASDIKFVADVSELLPRLCSSPLATSSAAC